MTQFPTFYNPNRIGSLFYPDMNAISLSASQANLAPAVQDKQNVHLVIIDMQVDFCHTAGNLHVPGAQGDIQRLIEFIYRNGEHITNITCSLDSHLPFQIFNPSWWADADGNHPAPFTLITWEDIKQAMMAYRIKGEPVFLGTWTRKDIVQEQLRYGLIN